MRVTARSVLAGACIGAAGALAAAPACAPAWAQTSEPYRIDVVLPLTGGGAFLGRAEQQSLQTLQKSLAPGALKGRPVEFTFHDDQSSPQVAVQLATQLSRATPKPAVVLGSALVAMCNAMAPLMRSGPVLYCFSPGIYPPADSYVFSSSVATRDLAAGLLRYAGARGWTRVALITSTDASGQDAVRNIKGLLAQPENKALQLVAEQSFNPTDVSASAQVERLKGADPQLLIAWTTGAPVGTVFKAVLDAGWDIPVATTNGNMTYAQMTQYAAFLPKQLYIPSSPWPKEETPHLSAGAEQKKDAFFKAFAGTGVKPDGPASFAWDPAAITLDALRSLGPDATAQQLRDYLAKLKGYDGINGTYDFVKLPQRGLDESNVVITRWDAGKGAFDVVSEPGGLPLK